MGRCTDRRVTVVWHENLFPARRHNVANVDMIVDVVGQNVVGAIVLHTGTKRGVNCVSTEECEPTEHNLETVLARRD